MFQHIERRDVIFILVMVFFIIAGIWFYSDKAAFNTIYGFDKKVVATKEPNSLDGKVAKTQTSSKNTANQKYLQSFENSLNMFLADVYEQMTEYRKRRKILSDVLRPENLKNSAYIQQGYQLTKQTIPDLTQRSENIIQSFSKKDADIRELIKNRPPAAQKNIWQAWENVKRNQGNLYVKYFTLEQDVLGSHEALMYHYFQNKERLQYNDALNTISFNDAELNAKTAQLKAAINNLKEQQKALSK